MGVKVLLLCLFAVAILAAVSGMPRKPAVPVPPTKPTRDYNATKPLKLFGPDMILTRDQQRSGVVGENYRWRGGIYMQIDRAFTQGEYDIINGALYQIHINLCIDVLLWPQDSNPTGDYVFIQRGASDTGCWSYVGKQGGRQVLNLQHNGCVDHGVAMHETIHALGFFHEQSRPDRDQYVQIHWQNIIPEYQYAFDRYDDTTHFNVPYDYTSIMHYNSHDFSHNGQVTLSAWNGMPVGSRGQMTQYDLQKLHRMYNC